MQPHTGNEWSRKVGTHLPVDADDLAVSDLQANVSESCFCQFARPADIFIVAGDKCDLTKGINPFGKIVEILTVPVPLPVSSMDSLAPRSLRGLPILRPPSVGWW